MLHHYDLKINCDSADCEDVLKGNCVCVCSCVRCAGGEHMEKSSSDKAALEERTPLKEVNAFNFWE